MIETLLPFLYIVIGFVLLYYGGDWLVLGAVRLAQKLDVSPVVIALTVVAFGTSLPELLVSFLGAYTDHSSLAIGNILGSNICNICIVAGICAILANPMKGDKVIASRDTIMLILSTVLFGVLGWDLVFSRVDGIIMVLVFLVYIYLVIVSDSHSNEKEFKDNEKESVEPESTSGSERTSGVDSAEDILEEFNDNDGSGCYRYIIAGLVLLPLGAHFLVTGGIEVARIFGISERFIAMTVISWGTSLPELATSVAAVLRGHSAMCVGNVVGSNIFNTLTIAGVTALFLNVDVPPIAYRLDFTLVCAATIVFALVHRGGKNVSRVEGLILFSGFIAMFVLLGQ
jgi:cation:H+ antiporter